MPRLFLALSAAALLLGCTPQADREPRSALRTDSAAPGSSPAPSPAVEAPPAHATQGIQAVVVDSASLPVGVTVRGRFVAARRWTDRLGDNLLLLVKRGHEECDEEDVCTWTSELFGYHYLLSGGGSTLLWRTQDAVPRCELDMLLEVHPRGIAITDEDGDGTAESTYVYALACRGDVSEPAVKLIMHEGAAKYAIRGYTSSYGGGTRPRRELDAAFAEAPAPLRAFALRFWSEFEAYDAWTPRALGWS